MIVLSDIHRNGVNGFVFCIYCERIVRHRNKKTFFLYLLLTDSILSFTNIGKVTQKTSEAYLFLSENANYLCHYIKNCVRTQNGKRHNNQHITLCFQTNRRVKKKHKTLFK